MKFAAHAMRARNPGQPALLLALLATAAGTDAPRVRVFDVGFKKTGTTSFSNACAMMSLREVGLESKARLLRVEAAALARQAAGTQTFFDIVDRYECFQDSPFTNPQLVPLLADRYASAKFVLTTRNGTAWAGSAMRWIDHKHRDNPNYGAAFWRALGWRGDAPPSVADAAALLAAHDDGVRAYFAGRNESRRLLELDFARETDAAAFWTRLCDFVGLPGRCPCPPVPRSNALGGPARDELGQPVGRRRRR